MLAWFLFACVVLVGLFQLWWAIGYAYAYRQVRAPLLLTQVAVGLGYVAFVAAIVATLLAHQQLPLAVVIAFMLIVGVSLTVWRMRGGPALQARHYPRGWRDVLALRRPAVDLRRRVRGK
jgi:hypothetical protein